MTLPSGSLRLYNESSTPKADKEFVTDVGSYHDLLYCAERQAVVDRIVSWLHVRARYAAAHVRACVRPTL